MIKKVSYIVFVFLITISFHGQSQKIQKFSKDEKEFQRQVKDFFKDLRDDRSREIVGPFQEILVNSEFTPAEYLLVQSTFNFLYDERFRPIHYVDFLEIIITYKQKSLDSTKIFQYIDVYKQTLAVSKRDAKDLNAAVLALFDEQAIFRSKSKTWFINTNKYTIGFDKQPYIAVNTNINLSCRTREDTLLLQNTSGIYYPVKDLWRGQNGKMDWRRVGLDTTKVYAQVNNYRIETKNSEVIADSVVFWNKYYFSSMLIGRLHDRANITYQGKKSIYPKFRSYKAVYILDRLSKNVLYIGGFTQEGLKVAGSSSMEVEGEPVTKARVIISYKGESTLIAESNAFMITPEKIVASNAAVTVYYEEDSIFHPQIQFNYLIDKRKLVLTRGSTGMYRSPFFNSFHKLEMEFDQLEWNIDEPLMDFRLFLGSEGSAWFTSYSFYTQNLYDRTQSILEYHPLEVIVSIAMEKDTNTITLQDYAWAVQAGEQDIESLIMRLSTDGFILYDFDNKLITLQDKAFLYVNANNEKADYDLLRFESIIKKNNAQFSLNSGNLDMEGIGSFMLSDTHRVFVYPRDQKITMKKDRNFEFDGYIRAGLFEFFGDEFYFDYDNFKIDMKDIDSVRFYVPVDPNKPNVYAKIKNVISNVSGHLYIDDKHNKSGRVNFPEYPIFECTKKSYVFYDNKEILGGNYDRERFYFELKPFTVDSLDNFTVEGLEFDGTFYSADILPVFDYSLTPQEDYSLGFTKKDNFPLYVGSGAEKGNGDLVINLSFKGLRGNGEIDYLTSITKSEDFIFYIDSMRSNSQSFDIEHNARGIYPQVRGTEVFTRWFPYVDTMIIEKLKNPFLIFEKELEFSGDLVLTPERLTSSGIFNYKDATIKSDEFVFQPTKLLSDKALLQIKSDIEGVFAFAAPNINLDFDVENEIVKGEVNSKKSRIKFPLNKYETTMRGFTWTIPDKIVELYKSSNQSDKSCQLLSTHEDQDSLIFQSSYAKFNLNDYILRAEKIPFIAVADAHIFPDSGIAVIEKNAYMQSLKNATIKADTINFHHKIYDGLVNVFGKYKYTGYGKYDYVDKYKNKEIINFRIIRVDENQRTYGRGQIPDSANFHISPRFKFEGFAEMNGNIKELNFDGYVIPDHYVKKVKTTWFAYNNRIDPDSVYFYLNDPKGREGRSVYTGVYMKTDSPYVYNLFFGNKETYSNPEIFRVEQGVLYFDDNLQRYVFADTNKVFYESQRGSLFTLDFKDGHIDAEGPIDFGENMKQIEIKTAGSINYDAETGKHLFDVIMMIDFPFDEKALAKMTDDIITNGYFRKSVPENRPEIIKAVSELIEDEKDREKAVLEATDFAEIPLVKEMQNTLVFTNLKLTFDLDSRMFQSDDEEIGLSNIGKTSIHKILDGGIQLVKKRSGTIMNIYFEADENYNYYFQFKYNIFSVTSSDPDYIEMVKSTIQKHSSPKYRIKIATNRDLDRFKRELKLY
jgi:hypothetical protein